MGKDGTLGNEGDRTFRRGSEVSDDIVSMPREICNQSWPLLATEGPRSAGLAAGV